MIKVKVDELNEELIRFRTAMNQFRPYSESFFTRTSDKLNGFNSDFVDKVKHLLANMVDTDAKSMLKKAQDLYDATKQTVDAVDKVDRDIVKTLTKGE